MANFLQGIMGSSEEEMITKEDVVILVERLKSASDFTDRKDAVTALLEASDKAQGLVGELGIPVFSALLKDGVKDEDMREGLIQILINLTTEKEEKDRPAVGCNISLILTDTQNIINMLDLLEDSDVYTTMLTLQLLGQLHETAGSSLESAILECPAGMMRLTDILQDRREEVRNDVILFLEKLTSSNEEFQKFFAFNGGFNHLLSIMQQEGMLKDGSPVVADCLNVLLNLLSGEMMIRSLFLQFDCLQQLLPLLKVEEAIDDIDVHEEVDEDEEPPSLTPMQEEIVKKAFQALLKLLAPVTKSLSKTSPLSEEEQEAEYQKAISTRAQIQSTMYQSSELFGLIKGLALPDDDEDTDLQDVQVLALEVICALTKGNSNVRDDLLFHLGDEALGKLIGVVMSDDAATDAAIRLFGAFYEGNEAACMKTMMHIIAPPPRIDDMGNELPPITPPGKLLLDKLAMASEAITGPTPPPSAEMKERAEALVIRGCQLLSVLLESGGVGAREMAMRVDAGNSGPLLAALINWTYEFLRVQRPGQNPLCGLAFLALLATWSCDCHSVCQELLENPANLFLVDLAAEAKISAPGKTSVASKSTAEENEEVQLQIKALSSMCVGFCMIFYEEERGDGVWTKQRILDMIENKVSIKRFTKTLTAFGKLPGLKINYGPIFPAFFAKGIELVRKNMIGLYTGTNDNGDEDTKESKLLQMQEEELTELKQKLEELQSKVAFYETEEGKKAAEEEEAAKEAKFQAELQNAQASAKQAKARMTEQECEIEKLLKDLKEKNEEMHTLESEKSRLEQELSGLAVSHDSLERQLEKLSPKVPTKMGIPEANTHQPEETDTVSQMQAFHRDLTDLQHTLERKDEDIMNCTAMIEGYKQRVQTLEEQLATVNHQSPRVHSLKGMVELEEKVTSLEEKVTQYKKDIDSRDEKISNLQELLDQMPKEGGKSVELEVLQRELKSKSASISEANTKLQEAQEQMANLQKEVEKAAAEKKELGEVHRQQVEGLQGEIEKAAAEKKQLESTNTNLTHKVEELELSHAAIKDAMEKAIDDNAEESSNKEAQLKRTMAEMQAKNADLNGKVEELELSKVKLQEAMDYATDAHTAELKSAFEESNSKEMKLQSSLQELESKNTELFQQIEQLELNHSSLQDAMKEAVSAKNDEIDIARQKFRLKEEHYQKSLSVLEKRKNLEIEKLQNQVSFAKSEVKTKEDQLAERKAQIEMMETTFKSDNEKLKSQLQGMEEALAASTFEKENISSMIEEEMRMLHDDLALRKEAVKEATDHLQEADSKHRSEISGVKSELEKSIQLVQEKQEELEDLKKTIEELEGTISQKEEEILNLEQRLEKHMEEMSSQLSEADGLEVLKKEMEDSRQRFEDKAAEAENQKQSLEKKVDELKKLLHDKDSVLSELKEQHAKSVDDLVQSHQTEIGSLKETTSQDAEEKLQSLHQQHIESMKKAQELAFQKGEQLSKVEKALENRNNEIHSLKSQLEEEQRQSEKMKEMNESLESDLVAKEEMEKQNIVEAASLLQTKDDEVLTLQEVISKLKIELEELLVENSRLGDIKLQLHEQQEAAKAAKTKLETSQKKIQGLSAGKVAIENRLAELISQKGSADTAFEDLMTQKRRIESQLQNLMEKQQVVEAKLDETEKKLHCAVDENDEVTDQLRKAEAQIEELKETLIEAETTHHKMKEELNKKDLTEKEEIIQQLQTELEEVQEKLTQKDEDIKNRKSVMEGYKNRLQALESELATARSESSSESAKPTDGASQLQWQEQFDSLKADILSRDKQILSLQEEMKSYEEIQKTLNDTLDLLKKTEDEKETADSQVEILQQRLQEIDNNKKQPTENGYKEEELPKQPANANGQSPLQKEAFELLLGEHEDLLVLLSQQEIEKEALKQVALMVGGASAVSRAQKLANEEAMKRFGCLPFEDDGVTRD